MRTLEILVSVPLVISACLLLPAASCQEIPTDPSHDAGSADAGVDAPDDSCAHACARLRELDCPGGEPTDAGTTCEEVCRDTEASGVARFCPDDVAQITTCTDLDRAFSACEAP